MSQNTKPKSVKVSLNGEEGITLGMTEGGQQLSNVLILIDPSTMGSEIDTDNSGNPVTSTLDYSITHELGHFNDIITGSASDSSVNSQNLHRKMNGVSERSGKNHSHPTKKKIE